MTELSDVLFCIKHSCKKISHLIKDSNPLEMAKLSDEYNLSGDNTKKLDLMSNEILKIELSKCKHVRTIGSEEEEQFVKTQYKDAPFMVCFDPLDGSSNIGVNITTGTIFAIYKYNNENKIGSGHNIVSAGYCLYGGATQYVLANSEKCSFYQYSICEKKFNCINSNLIIKDKGSIYSINESNQECWLDKRYNKVIKTFIHTGYSARWVGSLVADAHRTLIKGGFFAYPGNSKNINGKIRLLYEAYPFAYIFEKAGGFATNGTQRLLDIPFPDNIHEKTPIVLSGKVEMNTFVKEN